MSLRVLLVAAPLASLFFFSASVVARVNVTANCTLSSFAWTFNSIGQSPCTVAAYMLATCYAQSYTLAPLPSGYAYGGPTHDYSNKCECSTVGYSLVSACVECQGQKPFSWSEYVANCTSTLPPSQFPNPVPDGIRVPHWAILDVTNENNWNANESHAAGDNPEYGPGAIFAASGVYTSSASASSTGSPSPTPPPKGSSSNAGAIAGGVVGGLAVVSIAIAAIFYLRRRSRASSARSAGFDAFQPHMDEIPRPLSGGGTVGPSSPSIRTKFSDVPNDQTTFQWYAGPHSVDIPPPGTTSSHIGSGSNLANMQTSLPQTRRYHGLPMPSA
jgi:hypothetical protein